MAPKTQLPKQVTSNMPDGIRHEPQVPRWVFLLALGAVAALLGILYNQINSIKDNELKELQKRITILETKFEFCQDAIQKFQENTQGRLNNLEADSHQIIPQKNR